MDRCLVGQYVITGTTCAYNIQYTELLIEASTESEQFCLKLFENGLNCQKMLELKLFSTYFSFRSLHRLVQTSHSTKK